VFCKRCLASLLALTLLVSAIPSSVFASPAAIPAASGQTSPASALDGQPSMLFIENEGQFPGEVEFKTFGGDQDLTITNDAVWLTALEPQMVDPASIAKTASQGARPAAQEARKGARVKLSFAGANPDPAIEPIGRVDTKVSYFLGNDKSKWRPEVPAYSGLRYKNLYPGVDLELTSANGRFDWKWVANGEPAVSSASPNVFQMNVEGADSIDIASGVLQLDTTAGKAMLPLPKPVGVRTAASSASIDGNQVKSFVAAGASSPSTSAVIPPATGPGLVYSSFVGNGIEATASAVDKSGAFYVYGKANPGFAATIGAFDETANGNQNVAVMKISPSDSSSGALQYATFIGGFDYDSACPRLRQGIPNKSLAVGLDGSVVMVGTTESGDFPTTSGAFDSTFGGSSGVGDVFVTKLSQTGSELLYSTYLGGSSYDGDYGLAVALDTNGSVYVAGDTGSPDFPMTVDAYNTSVGSFTAFLAKLDPAGNGASDLIYSTSLDGCDPSLRGWSQATALCVDSSGCAYVAGEASKTFATTDGAYRTSTNWGDFFVIKMNQAGDDALYSTFLGADNGYDDFFRCSAIAVDDTGAVYITGQIQAYYYVATPGAYQRESIYCTLDAFVSKLSPSGTSLQYSTYLGGAGEEFAYDIAIDANGSAYVVGIIYYQHPIADYAFPTTRGALIEWDDVLGAEENQGFLAKLQLNGQGKYDLLYSTYTGNSGAGNLAVNVDAEGVVSFVGQTETAGFPVTSDGYNTAIDGTSDYYIAKLRLPLGPMNPYGGEQIASGSTYTVSWDLPLTASAVRLEYSDDGGGTYLTLADEISGTNHYEWQAPTPYSNLTDCYMRVTALDADGAELQSSTNPAPFTVDVADIVSPTVGASFDAGDETAITWNTNATVRPVHSVDLSFSSDGGANWRVVQSLTGSYRTYPWHVPGVGVSSSNCMIKAVFRDVNGAAVAEATSRPFSISAPSLLSPVGGELVASGGVCRVEWNTSSSTKNIQRVNINYSYDGGVTWKSIISTKERAGGFDWLVPAPTRNSSCLVRLRAFNAIGAKVLEKQSNPFTVEVIRLTSPTAATKVTSRHDVTITWHINATKAPISRVDWYYTLNEGSTWNSFNFHSPVGRDGSMGWYTPQVTKTKDKCQIKLVLKAAPGPGVPADLIIGVAKSEFFTINP
jgi:hypothetical protein